MSRFDIDQAVGVLRAGGVVGMPTETVYGLAADARNESAVRRVFELKGRPSTNPLIVHVASVAIAQRYAVVSDTARTLFERFSPGPLTIVLHVNGVIAPSVIAGLDTVGIRIPDHPVALELLRAFDGPLAAPSANRSNHISPTTSDHVRSEFGVAVPVLEGGACRVGIESTVLSLAGDVPRILRPGSVTREQIEMVIGPVEMFHGHVAADVAAASPGQQATHYAPRSPTFRFAAAQRDRVAGWLDARGIDPRSIAMIVCNDARPIASAPRVGVVRSLGHTPIEAAHALYAVLREVDADRPSAILIEMPPADDASWSAVVDRLSRAATPCFPEVE